MKSRIKPNTKLVHVIFRKILIFAGIGILVMVGLSVGLVGGAVILQSVSPEKITHDGSRTGPRVEYIEYCTSKPVFIYENEKIPFATESGTVFWTKGDIDCYKARLTQSSKDPFIETPELNNSTSNNDPIIDCQFSHNGVVKLNRSQCNLSFECQIGDKWYIYQSREKCTNDQTGYTQLYLTHGLIDCYDLGTKRTYRVSYATCEKWRQEYNQRNSTNTYSSYTPAPIPTPCITCGMTDMEAFQRKLEEISQPNPPTNYQQYTDEFRQNTKLIVPSPTPNCIQPGSIVGTNVIGSDVQVCK